MPLEPDHIFWLKRWDYARRICRNRPSQGMQTLTMNNYMAYLTEVFSFLFERRSITR